MQLARQRGRRNQRNKEILQVKCTNKDKQMLLANGWYRAAQSWWHLDLGKEPMYSGGYTIKKALQTMENWHDPRRNIKYKR